MVRRVECEKDAEPVPMLRKDHSGNASLGKVWSGIRIWMGMSKGQNEPDWALEAPDGT